MIRQAISCDICGNEKKHTNHWFVVYEQNGELRVTGWSSRNRLRPGTRHLCGQICLHKLVDDFMARAIGQKQQGAAPTEIETSAASTDTRTARAAFDDTEFESSARLITPASATLPVSTGKRAAESVAMNGNREVAAVPPADELRYASRNWRSEAWEREREREMRGQDCRTDLTRRRVNGR